MSHALRAYGGTWIALVALASASLLLSQVAATSAWATPVALVVAGVKALLIALFFMHLSKGRASIRIAAFTAVGLITILAFFMAADVVTRTVPVVAGSGAVSP